MDELLLKEIRSAFPIGSEWKVAEVKEKLKEIYQRHSITDAPKVSDLSEYLSIRISKEPSTRKNIVHIEKEGEE